MKDDLQIWWLCSPLRQRQCHWTHGMLLEISPSKLLNVVVQTNRNTLDEPPTMEYEQQQKCILSIIK